MRKESILTLSLVAVGAGTLVLAGIPLALGRVFGAFSATTALMLFVGSLSAGAPGDLAGIVPLLIVSAILYCAAGLPALIPLPRPRAGG